MVAVQPPPVCADHQQVPVPRDTYTPAVWTPETMESQVGWKPAAMAERSSEGCSTVYISTKEIVEKCQQAWHAYITQIQRELGEWSERSGAGDGREAFRRTEW
uniref:Elongation factor Ts n=1 Tax=Lygus hesperus TaxID=30085 RepID=A0A0A9XMX1_LYGHE